MCQAGIGKISFGEERSDSVKEVTRAASRREAAGVVGRQKQDQIVAAPDAPAAPSTFHSVSKPIHLLWAIPLIWNIQNGSAGTSLHTVRGKTAITLCGCRTVTSTAQRINGPLLWMA